MNLNESRTSEALGPISSGLRCLQRLDGNCAAAKNAVLTKLGLLKAPAKKAAAKKKAA
jgi:hypothetical protein